MTRLSEPEPNDTSSLFCVVLPWRLTLGRTAARIERLVRSEAVTSIRDLCRARFEPRARWTASERVRVSSGVPGGAGGVCPQAGRATRANIKGRDRNLKLSLLTQFALARMPAARNLTNWSRISSGSVVWQLPPE